MLFGTSWDNITNESLLFATYLAVFGLPSNEFAWGGSTTNGALSGENCSNFSSSSSSSSGDLIQMNAETGFFFDANNGCNNNRYILCICY